MSDESSSSDEDLYNFVAIHEKKVKEYNVKKKDVTNKPTDKKDELDIVLIESDEEQPKTDLAPSNFLDCYALSDAPGDADYSLANSSGIVTRNRRSTRRRNNVLPVASRVIGTTISVGDFDDGYDIPPSIVKSVESEEEKTSRMKKERLKQLDNDYLILELNRIVNVKVSWSKERAQKFPIRKYQSIESIYEHFAKAEKINKSEVLLRLNNKRLFPSDSPISINYRFGDIIEGEVEFYKSIYDKSITEEEVVDSDDNDEAKFKILVQNSKHPLYITMKKTDQLAVVYIKLSEQLGLDMKSFTLEFDGDKIDKSGTLESLDLDGDECFELFLKS